MRKIINNNRGSITVEMCFVMPVVIAVVMILIFITLRGLNEGTVLGVSQLMVYEYSERETDVGKGTGSSGNELQDGIMLDLVVGSFFVDENGISASVRSCENELYSISTMGCTRERNLCTDRLRRWQLYGNVLRE